MADANWTPGRQKAGHYICRTCTAKRQEDYKQRVGPDRVRARAAKAARERWNHNPDKMRKAKFASALKSRFGMSMDDYQALIAKQGGGCAICKTVLEGLRQVHTDHDHGTGLVRGILCQRCNLGLGHFRDDTKLLRAAIGYLIDPPA